VIKRNSALIYLVNLRTGVMRHTRLENTYISKNLYWTESKSRPKNHCT